MKKASRYLKQLFSAVVAAVKATAVGTRASSLRTRLIVLGIMRNKRLLLSAIRSKIHAIMGGGGASQGGYYGGEASEGAFRGGAGEHHHHHLLGGSAAVLQSLPSFVVEQETRAVVPLSSLPSFALERGGGGAAEEGCCNDYGEAKVPPPPQQLVELDAAAPGSAIEVARGAAAEGEFRLEDEIDRVADVFIRRFHDQMKLQKLESFKRFCEMLERGA